MGRFEERTGSPPYVASSVSRMLAVCGAWVSLETTAKAQGCQKKAMYVIV